MSQKVTGDVFSSAELNLLLWDLISPGVYSRLTCAACGMMRSLIRLTGKRNDDYLLSALLYAVILKLLSIVFSFTLLTVERGRVMEYDVQGHEGAAETFPLGSAMCPLSLIKTLCEVSSSPMKS